MKKKLLFIILILLCMIVILIFYRGINKNKEDYIETNNFDVSAKNENENKIKVLIEKNTNHTGMPSPNGSTDWGNSIFIGTDGYIYEYRYDEYSDGTSYPSKENMEELSRSLIDKSINTQKKIENDELEFIVSFIKNFMKDEEKEEIKLSEETIPPVIVVADDVISTNIIIYDYSLNKKYIIDTEKKVVQSDGIYYTSSSIDKLTNIVDKYLN